MSTFFKIIRWPNVLLTILTQLVIVYGLLIPSLVVPALNWWQLLLLLSATGLLTASGNVINDIYDVAIDQINKPEKLLVTKSISETSAYNLYFVLTILAVICGFVLANSLDKPILSSVFVGVAFVLYLYASSLKSMLLVGNLVISILVALVILITGVFELFPVITEASQPVFKFLMERLLEFSLMAFLINVVREWVKDCEDVNGDKAGGRNTLAIALGRTRAARFIAFFILGILILLGWFVYEYIYLNDIITYYFIFLIMGPLMFVMIKLWSAQTQKEFHILSTVLKVVLLFGILSIGIFRINYYLN
ncbi:prenyltransferase [Nonlabens sp. MB-3u-79]|uniref:geranylgeranylglycerol-phosphate geranylgeranyltransferase n=1 Tax=Nonlabens sp. MB-3u-79 TaxID=2058134 RepID=UPI000C31AFED|nr:geranylgeranylglycerol-phosphate geranylgeranyltransferase [Nonlabens sp. MB-3u-79]AUC79866.1 prenyltransferase [Nonlabens sp. MB-3u-79]|tara:strand:- start:4031 stop:4951 length:921 start_codon:yes stop_codon:yes gene_type:complete